MKTFIILCCIALAGLSLGKGIDMTLDWLVDRATLDFKADQEQHDTYTSVDLHEHAYPLNAQQR